MEMSTAQGPCQVPQRRQVWDLLQPAAAWRAYSACAWCVYFVKSQPIIMSPRVFSVHYTGQTNNIGGVLQNFVLLKKINFK